jgi:hypothetical protein
MLDTSLDKFISAGGRRYEGEWVDGVTSLTKGLLYVVELCENVLKAIPHFLKLAVM